MYQTTRHIRFLETRAMRASDNAAAVRVKAEAMDDGSFKDYLVRLGADYDRIADPLVRSLLADGVVRPDALRLGLDVTQGCALLHRDGSFSRRLFAVGPLTRAAFWEIVAIPDIRNQCAELAARLAAICDPVIPPSNRSGRIEQASSPAGTMPAATL